MVAECLICVYFSPTPSIYQESVLGMAWPLWESPKKINAKTSPFRTATPGHLNNTEKVIHKHNICVHMQVYFAAN